MLSPQSMKQHDRLVGSNNVLSKGVATKSRTARHQDAPTRFTVGVDLVIVRVARKYTNR